MLKSISSKSISLIFGILVLVFAIGFYVFAWKEPTQPPPLGNISIPWVTETRVIELIETRTRTIIAEMAGNIMASKSTRINNAFIKDLSQGDQVCRAEFGSGWRWCDGALWDKYHKTALPEGQNFLLKSGLQECQVYWDPWYSNTLYYLPAGSGLGSRPQCIETYRGRNIVYRQITGPMWEIYRYQRFFPSGYSCHPYAVISGTAGDHIASCMGQYYSVNHDWRLACCPPSQ